MGEKVQSVILYEFGLAISKYRKVPQRKSSMGWREPSSLLRWGRPSVSSFLVVRFWVDEKSHEEGAPGHSRTEDLNEKMSRDELCLWRGQPNSNLTKDQQEIAFFEAIHLHCFKNACLFVSFATKSWNLSRGGSSLSHLYSIRAVDSWQAPDKHLLSESDHSLSLPMSLLQ